MNPAGTPNRTAGRLRGPWDNPAVCRLKTAYHRVNILKPLKKNFSRRTVRRILEFGPGLGCLIDLAHTAWPQAEYHAADMDAGLLTSLSGRFPFLQTRGVETAGDLQRIEGRFDVIAAVDVWEHLSLPDALAYTAWCWQRLEPGGIFILQTPNWGCPVTPSVFCSDLTHRTAFNEESIRQLLRNAGIPEEACRVLPRKTPGFLGFIRDCLTGLFGRFYRLMFIFFGSVRLKIFSPDLVAVVCKPEEKRS